MSRLIIFLFYIVSLLYGFQLKKFNFQLNQTDEITKGAFFFVFFFSKNKSRFLNPKADFAGFFVLYTFFVVDVLFSVKSKNGS